MIFFKIAVAATAVVALASAWSPQFSQFFRALPPAPPPPPPHGQIRSFFPEPMPQQLRFFAHQPQFQHSPQFYQPPSMPVTRLPAMRDLLSPTAAPADVHHHHHVHYYYYYYLPADGETRLTAARNGFDRQQSSNGPTVTAAAGCHPSNDPSPSPPVYLPPALPSPPTPTTVAPSATQGPCNDDTVVVDNADNVDYFPFGRTPIVVATAPMTDGRDVKHYERSGNTRRDQHARQNADRPGNNSNFILANYLLPPDK